MTSARSTPSRRPAPGVRVIPVGVEPTAVAVDPAGYRAYVSNGASRTVSVLDLAAAEVVATIEVPGTPAGLDVSADGRTLHVAETDPDATPAGRLTVVDTARATHLTTFPVGESASEAVCWPDGRVSVIDRDGHTIVTVDPTSGSTATAVLPDEHRPGAPVVVPAAGELIVPITSAEHSSLLAVDAAGSAVRARLELDFRPGRCALTPDARTLYLCDPAHGLLHRIDPAALWPSGEPVAVDDGVSDVAVDPAGGFLHVVGHDRLWTLDRSGHVAVGDPVPLPGGASDLALAPDGRRAVVVLYWTDSIAVVELRRAE